MIALSIMKFLTPLQFQQYERDGFLVIDNFLTPLEVTRTKEDIDRVCKERSQMTKDADGFNLEKIGDESLNKDAQAKQAGMLRKIQGAVFHVAAVRDVFISKKMLDCMNDVVGPNLYYHSSKIMFKPANGGAPKPWHQDAAYWKEKDPNQVTVWIAIDDATEENGCVWAIPGSHKLGHIPHVHAELQVEESKIDPSKAIPVPVRAGGLLIFHSLVLHMSKKNTSDKNRCAIICDYDCMPYAPMDGMGREKGLVDERGAWVLREEAPVAITS
jgi:phytanoyl-CoA hydroxylase